MFTNNGTHIFHFTLSLLDFIPLKSSFSVNGRFLIVNLSCFLEIVILVSLKFNNKDNIILVSL